VPYGARGQIGDRGDGAVTHDAQTSLKFRKLDRRSALVVRNELFSIEVELEIGRVVGIERLVSRCGVDRRQHFAAPDGEYGPEIQSPVVREGGRGRRQAGHPRMSRDFVETVRHQGGSDRLFDAVVDLNLRPTTLDV